MCSSLFSLSFIHPLPQTIFHFEKLRRQRKAGSVWFLSGAAVSDYTYSFPLVEYTVQLHELSDKENYKSSTDLRRSCIGISRLSSRGSHILLACPIPQILIRPREGRWRAAARRLTAICSYQAFQYCASSEKRDKPSPIPDHFRDLI